MALFHIDQPDPHLFAFDLGLSFGWALFNQNTELIVYGSQHFSQRSQMRAMIPSILKALPAQSHVCIEGGGELFGVWERAVEKYELSLHRYSAQDWRKDVFLARECENKDMAKKSAIKYAQNILVHQKSNFKASNDNTAEAILFGYWMLKRVGWLSEENFKKLIK